jgi:cell fate (sporulation/competence/biofilm development) regulator YlbF (YheA/YmcA/DUF963 family)
MNVYDEAHNLARAIKESGEFAEFDKLRKEVENDKEVSEMIGEFQKIQMELQAAQMQGKQPEQATITRMQNLSTMLATKPLAARFMQAQAAFSVMMNDVFQIIGDAIGLQ